jgi:phosphatidylglycerophosphatase A
MKFLAKLFLSGFGTGYLPIAPGTWGSAAVLGIYLLAGGLWPDQTILLAIMAVIAILSSIACVAFGRLGEVVWNKKDPSQCVADEWAGQAVAMFWLPMLPRMGYLGLAIVAGASFVAFRVFDIFKPPPARQLEKLPRGWGVLLDDIAAGIYTNLVVQVAVLIFAAAN